MVDDILSMFIDQTTINILGNWYPRVYAVMSCVIPFTFILGSFLLLALIWREVCRLIK